MLTPRLFHRLCLPVAVAAAAVVSADAQAVRHSGSVRWSFTSNVIVPQARAFRPPEAAAAGAIEITDVSVGVAILEQVATTTMDIALRNGGRARQEAQLVIPVPDGAAVRGFTFEGSAREPTAEVLTREEARNTYNAIVAKIRDPALLEFVGYNAIRSSVFPVEAGGTQKVRVTYEHLLPADGNRIDYELPRSETIDAQVPWQIRVSVRSAAPVSTLYSPTHEVRAERLAPGRLTAQLERPGRIQPGAFRLSYLLEQGGVSASLLAYPDPAVGGGYFLLLAGLPAELAAERKVRREVTLVFDRSGSMNGEKIRQVREAAFQVLDGLDTGEYFNIIAYNEAVDLFSPRPVERTAEHVAAARRFLEGTNARGGTNIHDALLEALRQPPAEGTLPIVLFLTDGIPTIGQTSEQKIREMVESGNAHGRRVFTFGVGTDVNAPLLDRVATVTRAVSAYVLPSEDVEVKVAGVFRRLSGPVLSEPALGVTDAQGEPRPGRIRDLLPAALPDLFDGDRLVLLGQYVGDEPLRLRLAGRFAGEPKTFRFEFGLDRATTRNAFVPRLWATRKIADLIEAVRQMGGGDASFAAKHDPKVRELTDEIVRLSVEFGILTEYTAFLAREGTDLSARDEVLAQVEQNLRERAVQTRSGLGAVNQSANVNEQSRRQVLNRRNEFWDPRMNRVQTSRVQQVNDRAFYQQGDRWVDARVVARGRQEADEVIRIGSPEFLALAERLAERNRQGSLALQGEILLEVDGRTVLCR